MVTCLLRANLVFLRRRPWQTWLNLLGILLGVAVVVAVDLANQSARKGFQLSMEQVTGRTTHQLLSVAADIPEAFYVDLVKRRHLRATPIVEGQVGIQGQRFSLVGVDFLTEGPFRSFSGQLSNQLLRPLLVEPGSLLMTPADARRLGLEVDMGLDLHTRQGIHRGRLVGLLDSAAATAMEGWLLTDIATAQEYLGKIGRLGRIDLILDPGETTALVQSLPPGLRLVEPEIRSAATAQLSQAFHTNLSALSLLALLVGALLVYNTMTFSVLQRRPLLANLRVLGVTRGQLFRLILVEAFLFGLLGSALGLLLGMLIAQGLVHLVTRTINDLYYVLHVRELILSPAVLMKGLVVGILTTLAAALGPALEAAGSRPQMALRRSVLEIRSHRIAPWLAMGGLLLGLLGWLMARWPGQSLEMGFAALFVLILGYSLVIPYAIVLLNGTMIPVLARFWPSMGRLAGRGLSSGLSRTGLAISALSVAVSATVGMGVMVASFRATLEDWLGYTLKADIYVSAPYTVSRRADGLLPEGVMEALRARPEVAELSSGRRLEIDTSRGPQELLALSMAEQSHRGFRFRGETLERLWDRFRAGELLLVSEPFAHNQGLGPGDHLEVFTPMGNKAFLIGGVFYDYGSSRGLLALDRGHYARLWNDPAIATLGVYLRSGSDLGQALIDIRRVTEALDEGIMVRDNRSLREQSMQIFERTFTITQVLRLLAIGVAFVGILSAWMALFLEKAREHALLRAIGVTPGQLLGLVLIQTGLMGLMAGLFALPIGLLMAQVLIEVINLRSFGWTLAPLVPAGVLIEAVWLALSAALLAGLYPARRISRIPAAAALREE